MIYKEAARTAQVCYPEARLVLRKHAMEIKLYYHPLSTYSRRVRIALAEKQIPHELVVVDMAARRHREQPYLLLNPYGRVPTLEEDGFILFEFDRNPQIS